MQTFKKATKSLACTHGYIVGYCPECKSMVEFGKKVKRSFLSDALNKLAKDELG